MNTSGAGATYVLWGFAIVASLVGLVEFWRHVYPTLKDTWTNHSCVC